MAEPNIKAVRWLQFSHVMIDCYPGFIAPILPFITAKIGVQMSAAMLIIGIANITSYLMQPYFGYLADKCNKRFFIFWGILIASVFIPLMGFAQNFMALTIAIVLGEIGVGFFHPQATSFLPIFCKSDEQAKWDMGCFLSMGSVGYAVGAMVSTKLFDLFGSEALIFTSLFGILTAFSMFLFVPKLSCEKSGKKFDLPLKKCLTSIFSHPIERTLIGASIVKSLIISSFTMIMPFYWKSIGFNASKIGIISCLFLVTSTLGMLCSPKSEKLIGTRNTFYFSFLTILPTAIICILLIKINLFFAIFAYTVVGFLAFLTQPINVVMSQKLLPECKSMISGIVGGFTWGIVGIMLPLLSLFAEKTGILTAIFIISCVPVLYCFFLKSIPEKPID